MDALHSALKSEARRLFLALTNMLFGAPADLRALARAVHRLETDVRDFLWRLALQRPAPEPRIILEKPAPRRAQKPPREKQPEWFLAERRAGRAAARKAPDEKRLPTAIGFRLIITEPSAGLQARSGTPQPPASGTPPDEDSQRTCLMTRVSALSRALENPEPALICIQRHLYGPRPIERVKPRLAPVYAPPEPPSAEEEARFLAMFGPLPTFDSS